MADSLDSADCPIDEPCDTVDVDGVNWDTELTHQVGEYDAFGPFSDRDACLGPA